MPVDCGLAFIAIDLPCCDATLRFHLATHAIAETLASETTDWADDVGLKQRNVDWPLKLDDARCKLKSVYPKIQEEQSTRLYSGSKFVMLFATPGYTNS